MMKKWIATLLTLALVLSCGAVMADAAAPFTGKITIGATPSPHAEILEFAKPLFAEKGIELEIIEFTDYILPNQATESGELFANYFQHKPYMVDFNANNGTHLVEAIAVHFEPMAIYPGRTATLDAIQDGALIAVPNDSTNEARALLLLEANGLITIAPDKGVLATKDDVIDNPHNIELVEMEAVQVPLKLPDVDFAVINGNYALGVGLSAATDSLAAETADSLSAETYINYVVVKEGADEAMIAALRDVLNSQAVIDFMTEKYQGAVIPMFTVEEVPAE